MKRILYVPLLFLFAVVLLASCARVNIKDGLQAYEEMRYDDAITNLNKGLKKIDDTEARRALATSYAETNQFTAAAEVYELASHGPEFTDEDRINHGRVLMSLKRYDEAETIFAGILSRDASNREVQALRNSCRKAGEMLSDSSRYNISPVFANGLLSTYAPVIANDVVYFSGTKKKSGETDPYTGDSYTDLYEAPLNGVNFGNPKKVAGVNGKYHDGIASISPDGNTMVLTRSNYGSKYSLNSNEANINTTQLYISIKEEGKWSTPQVLPFCKENFMYAHPAWSKDGKHLYFASDMQGGYGGMDLYHVQREGGIWGVPENLGIDINSAGDELFPSFRSADSLYFSSNGHQTFGGQDVLYSVKRNDQWTTPIHLPYPLNSSSDDFGMAFTGDGSTGFFSSDRSGLDMIYYYVANEAVFTISGFVNRKYNDAPIANAKITISNLTDGTEEVVYSDDLGMFDASLLPQKNYKVRIEKDGFFAVNENINTGDFPEGNTFKMNTSLLDISNPDENDVSNNGNGSNTDNNENGNNSDNNENGNNSDNNGSGNENLPKGVSSNSPYEVPNILWDYDKAVVREDAKPYLDYLAKLIKDNPDLKVEIRSHCDSRGDDAYNDQLSERRAKAVTDYLIKKGVKRSAVTSKGMGKRELINKCTVNITCSESDHQENRRTDFRVVN